MKSAWRGTTVDWAAINSAEVEEVDLAEYEELLEADVQARTWDDEDEENIFESDIE